MTVLAPVLELARHNARRQKTGRPARQVRPRCAGTRNPVRRETSAASARATLEAVMRTQLLRRLVALEQRLQVETEPGKMLLPAWLIAEYRAQGFSFDHDGRPDMKSGVPRR